MVISSVLVGAAVLAALLLRGALRRWAGFLVEVESVSMAPTLLPGQRLLARQPGAKRPLRRGDLVVVDSVELGRPVVKRLVGLAGEHVDVIAGGRVRVDGRDLVEPYLVHEGGLAGVFQVPADHLLLLGDNRAASSDARIWAQPYLPVSAVLGRVVRSGWSSAADGTGPAPPPIAAYPLGSRQRSAGTRAVG